MFNLKSCFYLGIRKEMVGEFKKCVIVVVYEFKVFVIICKDEYKIKIFKLVCWICLKDKVEVEWVVDYKVIF